MQNKAVIIILAVSLALVSIYQLSFTVATSKIKRDAKEYRPIRNAIAHIILIPFQLLRKMNGVTWDTVSRSVSRENSILDLT